MGESIVDLPGHSNKMGETDDSSSGLEVSVSFGRFENDSLSWEKWSSFSPNKYLEEVEKCATPGSVAKKAAYFEAHYKKIAARKAEVMDQEKQLNHDVVSSDDPNGRDLINEPCGMESNDAEFTEFNVFKEPNSSEGFEPGTDLINKTSVIDLDDLPEEDVITMEFNTLSVERGKEELHNNQVNTMLSKSEEEREIEELQSNLVSPTLSKSEEVVSVKEVVDVSIDTQGIKETPQIAEKEVGYDSKTKEEVEKVKAKNAKESPKVTPMKKQSNVGNVKKKSVSTITKTPKNATPRVSKSVSTSKPVPLSKSPATKENCSSLPRSKNPPATDTKKVGPKSAYMSLSLGPKTPDSSSVTVPRKSLIMEKMGDKEIVKRAFKTFHNSFSSLRSSSEDRSSLKKQQPTQLTEANVSTSVTPRKENERPIKTSVIDKRSSNIPSSSFGLRSEEREEKRKELSKKLEATHSAKEAEKTRFQSKPKEEKEADVKKLRQNLNTKATLVPGSNRRQKVTKSISDKMGSKSGVRQ